MHFGCILAPSKFVYLCSQVCSIQEKYIFNLPFLSNLKCEEVGFVCAPPCACLLLH